MRKTLVAALILACMASGCISTNTRGPNSGREAALNIDPGRSQSCYGGPVYVPCQRVNPAESAAKLSIF